MKKLIYSIPLFFVPLMASAQSFGNVETLLIGLGNLVRVATPIVVGIALLAFFWGLARYIFAAGDTEKKEEGRNIMIWGVIALFVMLAVFGIVNFIGSAVGIDTGGTIDVPNVL